MASPEQLPQSPERNTEQLGKAAQEQSERLRSRQERGGEISPDHQAEVLEKARSEAAKEALLSKEAGKEQRSDSEAGHTAIQRVTKRQKNEEYNQTLTRVRSHLSAPSRAFSRVIHNPLIEKTSEVAATTIARPNAILAGGIFAFVASGGIYLVARTLGYQLSGFETIGTFVFGFMLGIIYDFLRAMITGRSSS